MRNAAREFWKKRRPIRDVDILAIRMVVYGREERRGRGVAVGDKNKRRLRREWRESEKAVGSRESWAESRQRSK